MKNLKCKNGTMEQWNKVKRKQWNNGTMEQLNNGTMEEWKIEII